MLTYENSNYGIQIQYPSNWYKENVNSGSHNNSRLVDVVKFSPSSRNTSDNIECLDINIDNISDVQPITLAKYANNSIQDLRRDFKIIVLDKNASLSENRAYKLIYSGVEESINLKAILILTIKGDSHKL
jgi:hypothetical protein